MTHSLMNFYPMRMRPAFKNYIWGGRKLNMYNKFSNDTNIAESWEVSCNENGLSVIDNGKFVGKTLKEVIKIDYNAFVGIGSQEFPLIVKLINAEKDLSIQVHPSDLNADVTKNERGKSELWYILDCDKNSFIYYGFKKNVTSNEFIENVQQKTICDLLNKVYVKNGDMIYIPAGTIHSLGSGIIVTEIQQNSDTTFRIYDYNRQDVNGNFRELHIDKAKNVLNFNKTVVDENVCPIGDFFSCKYFSVKKVCVNSEKIIHKGKNSFNIVQCIFGNGNVCCEGEAYKFNFGDTFFIPAQLSHYTIEGSCTFLLIGV